MKEPKHYEIPHPRAGQSYRVLLDHSTCVVIGALVRQVTSLTEAVAAIRAHVDQLTGNPLQDDPLDVPHLEETTLRLYNELLGTATRLELTYRVVQRARAVLVREVSDAGHVSRETDEFFASSDEVAEHS